MATAVRTSVAPRRVGQVREGVTRWRTDVLAVEEPLEIRVLPDDRPNGPGPARAAIPVAVTMRTPGHDFELAAGFLFTEGLLHAVDQVRTISYCVDPDLGGGREYNVVSVALRPGEPFDAGRLRRHFYASSSCGVCGKASLDALRARGVGPVGDPDFRVGAATIARLGDALRGSQRIFDRTGGLHAAGLFDAGGRLVQLREDVGRHNAVDKLVGWAFLERRLPLAGTLLVVSGRASFEIVQKAAAAGIPVVVAVSAPSSLACDAAREFGMTLVGFARGDRFNVYSGAARLRL